MFIHRARCTSAGCQRTAVRTPPCMVHGIGAWLCHNRRIHDRPTDSALPDRPAARRGRHGRRLRSRGHAARPARRAEVPAAEHRRGRRGVERFQREARIASSLNHPNICTIYDSASTRAGSFIAMELLEGESLRGADPRPAAAARADPGRRLPARRRARRRARQGHHPSRHQAGQHLHHEARPGQAARLRHRQARRRRRQHDATAETRAAGDVLTMPGMAVGSINYMSPEQARGEELDGRTDLFSLGLVLYEMATGRQAFGGQTTAVVFDAHPEPSAGRSADDEPGRCPEELTARHHARRSRRIGSMRYQTAADMLAELAHPARHDRRRPAYRRATAAAAICRPRSRRPSDRSRRASGGRAAIGTRRWLMLRRRRWSCSPPSAATSSGDPRARPALTERDTVLDRRLRELDRRPGVRRRAEAGRGRAAAAVAVPDAAARSAHPAHAAADAAAARRAGRRRSRARGVPARRRQGHGRRIDRAARVGLRHHPRARTTARPASRSRNSRRRPRARKTCSTSSALAVTALREHLGESLASIQKYDVPVTDATTKSLEALRPTGRACARAATQGRRGVDSVLQAGGRAGSELRARLRQARRRHRQPRPGRRRRRRTRSRRTSCAIGSASTSGSTSTGTTPRACCRIRRRSRRRSSC